MRTLLRKIKTGLYFQGPDRWTNNPSEALDFKMIDRAVQFVQQWSLEDVEVAFAFAEHGAVKTMPVDKISPHYLER